MSYITEALSLTNLRLKTIEADISELKDVLKLQTNSLPNPSAVSVNSVSARTHEVHHDQSVVFLEKFEFNDGDDSNAHIKWSR